MGKNKIKAEDHIALAIFIANKWYGKVSYKYSHDEIKSIALVGLAEAIKRFDEKKGFAFSTFAFKTIVGRIVKNIKRDKWHKKTLNKDEQDMFHLSLEETIHEGTSKNITLLDALESIEDGFEKIELRMLINSLAFKQKKVIEMLFFKGMTQDQVAKELNINQMNVSRIKKKALSNLKRALLE